MKKIKEWLKNHKGQIFRSLLIIGIVATIGVCGYLILWACGFTNKEQFEALRNDLGDSIWFWLVIALLQIFQVIFIPISNQIITVPLALMFPTNELWKVFLCSWLSIWIATMILYLIGRLGGEKILNFVLKDKEQVEKCTKWLNKGKYYYIILMWLPFPDDIVTILAGTSHYGFVYIAIASLITRAVDIACSVWGFGYLTRYWWGWLILAVGIILLGVGTWLFKRYDTRRNQRKEEEK